MQDENSELAGEPRNTAIDNQGQGTADVPLEPADRAQASGCPENPMESPGDGSRAAEDESREADDPTPGPEDYEGSAPPDNPGGEGGFDGAGNHSENTPEAGQQVPAKEYERIDWRDVGLALKESNGNRRIAAKALGLGSEDLALRINNHATLKALYGDPDNEATPDEEVFTRRPRDNPLGEAMSPEELASATHQQDLEIKLQGYSKLGVSDKTLERLRTLDGMAKTAGEWLSTSVQTSYQMYSIEQVHLFEEVEEIRQEMKAARNLTASEKLDMRRLYLEYMRELGKGHQQQFAAAAAIAQMLMAASARGITPERPVASKRRPKIKRGFTDVESTPGQ